MPQQPCYNCPFRSDKPFPLRRERVVEIHKALMQDGAFDCHKTTVSSDDGERISTRDSRPCIGATLYLERVRPGGCIANVNFRLAVRLGLINYEKLDRDFPIYNSLREWVKGASD